MSWLIDEEADSLTCKCLYVAGIELKVIDDAVVAKVVVAIGKYDPGSTLATTTESLAALEGPVPFALTPLTVYVYVPSTAS